LITHFLSEVLRPMPTNYTAFYRYLLACVFTILRLICTRTLIRIKSPPSLHPQQTQDLKSHTLLSTSTIQEDKSDMLPHTCHKVIRVGSSDMEFTQNVKRFNFIRCEVLTTLSIKVWSSVQRRLLL
jgi:hypothetical protein